MIKVSILYPNKDDSRFDEHYYLNRHMPETIRKLQPSLKGVSVECGLSGGLPESPPPYIAMCHLLFDSVDDFYAAFSPHADERMADVKNYTDIAPIIQIGEVRLFRSEP